MTRLLEPLAFALLIGGQFLATIFHLSKRALLYPDASQSGPEQFPPQMTDATKGVETRQAEI